MPTPRDPRRAECRTCWAVLVLCEQCRSCYYCHRDHMRGVCGPRMKWPDQVVRIPRQRSGGGLGVPAEIPDADAFRRQRSSEGRRITEGFKMLDMENFQ